MKFRQVDKKIIGFDLDGVIVDFTDLKIHTAGKKGFIIKPKETPVSLFERLIPRVELENIKEILYSNPEIAPHAPLMLGARDGIKTIAESGVPYFLISRRRASEQAVACLKIHNLWPKYFNEKNTFFVTHPEDKNTKAIECGITHYIDDEILILNKLVDVKNRFLFDPHRVLTDSGECTRIHSWEELLNAFLNKE